MTADLAPPTLFTLALGGLALVGLALLVAARRRMRRRRHMAGTSLAVAGILALAIAVSAGLLSAGLQGYARLTHEQPAANILVAKVGDRSWRVRLTWPGGESKDYDLRGDEWQVDARVLKWNGLANVAGFDTVYRLERIGGRYTDVASERAAPRTVYELNPPSRIDTWELARTFQKFLPGVDARYGSATFLPMADGALYQVTVSQSGLVARPLNDAARSAAGGWR